MNKFQYIAETETLRASLPKLMDNDRTALTNSSSVDFPAASEENIGRFFHHSGWDQVFICRRDSNGIITWKMTIDCNKSIAFIEDDAYAAKNHTHPNYADMTDYASFQKDVTAEKNFLLGGNLYSVSDKRMKSNIQPIEGALSMIEQIKGRVYTMNNDGSTQYGVIAQDVKAVAPYAVTTRNDKQGTLAVNYHGLVALLIESVKTLSDKVDNLENQILNIENK